MISFLAEYALFVVALVTVINGIYNGAGDVVAAGICFGALAAVSMILRYKFNTRD